MTIRAWPFASPPLGVPFSVNRASPQAVGLIEWVPAARNPHGGALAGAGYSTVSTLSSVVPDPVVGVAVASPGTSGVDVFEGMVTSTNRTAGLTNLSLAFWMKWTSGGGIWSNNAFGDGTNNSFIDSASGGTWRILFRGSGGSNDGSTGLANPLVSGQWTHVCITRTTSAMLTYRNGVLLQTFGAGGQSLANTGASVGMTLGMSRRGTGGASQASLNSCADLRLYNRALSAAEVFALWAPQTRWDLYGVRAPRGRAAISAAGDALFNRPFSPVFRGAFG